MTESEILTLAERYLLSRNSRYVCPGTLGKCAGDNIEVVFLKPEALEPDTVIDPPDIRVLVNIMTKEVTLVHQI